MSPSSLSHHLIYHQVSLKAQYNFQFPLFSQQLSYLPSYYAFVLNSRIQREIKQLKTLLQKIMKHNQELSFRRTSNNNKIIPSTYTKPTSSFTPETDQNQNLLIRKTSSSSSKHIATKPHFKLLSNLLRSFLKLISFPTIPTCKWLTIPTNLSVTPTLGRKVIGTLFGYRRGHVSFAVQFDPRVEPILLLTLATSTSSLVKEMSTGLVRIALECEKANGTHVKLFNEPMWSMYCNGRNCGYAVTRTCSESDWHVLRTVQSVSVGAGVIPVVDDGHCGNEGELLYMRAKFERVVGTRDSEAFYMLNPDGNGGPELSIFLLRV